MTIADFGVRNMTIADFGMRNIQMRNSDCGFRNENHGAPLSGGLRFEMTE